MIEAIGTIATVLAVLGVVLNNRRRRECFIVWIFSNLLTLGVHVAVGVWSMVTRDVIFLALAVEGMILWKRNRYDADEP